MRLVAIRAIFHDWRVLPEEWPAFVGVTRRAQLRDRIAFAQQAHVGGAVDVVAGGAHHLAFTHRHVTGSIDLGDFVAMAVRAEVEL